MSIFCAICNAIIIIFFYSFHSKENDKRHWKQEILDSKLNRNYWEKRTMKIVWSEKIIIDAEEIQ